MFRPSLTMLESRENPSGVPFLDPVGGNGIPPQDPTDPALVAPMPATPTAPPTMTSLISGAAYTAVVSINQSVDPFLAINSLTGQYLIP